MIEYINIRIGQCLKDLCALLFVCMVWTVGLNVLLQIRMEGGVFILLFTIWTLISYLGFKLLSLSNYLATRKLEHKIFEEYN
jgi:hypothetical protein